MRVKHHLLAAAYPVLRLKSIMLNAYERHQQFPLRVLMCHDVAPDAEQQFLRQLQWLQHSWSFVTPQMFERMISGESPIEAPSLLLTFDDGFASNRRVAEIILNPLGIKALFFVVSEFVDYPVYADCKGFISKHIHPGLSLSEVPEHWSNMNWSDLEFLLDSGHMVGAHTSTHARLSEMHGAELEAEIISSADRISDHLGCAVRHFAFPFGNVESFSAVALKIARKRFPYVYTGLRGINGKGVYPWAIRRDAMQASDSTYLLGAFLEGGADRLYRHALVRYEEWGLHA